MTQPEIEIRSAWRRVAGPEHEGCVDALLLRYAEPHRYYHTATHVMKVLWTVHDLSALEGRQPSPELIAAALYHDAVYDPRADDNEARSAALAAGDLALVGWSIGQRDVVKALIGATADHLASQVVSNETAILLDADLSILGADPLTYQAYVTGVRAEYFFVEDEHWRVGRGRVLRGFLDNPRLFATEYMHVELEHRARANIHAELAALASRPTGAV
jgi:predicted metal-dependent HD superfamily phosphohydrolase